MSLGSEYYYNSFPLCIIDAVFSVRSWYISTRNTVDRYCKYYDIKIIRKEDTFPSVKEQHTVNDLINNIELIGVVDFAQNILCNRQLTSSKNGILKAEAVFLWAEILREFKIQTFQDFNSYYSIELENKLKSIKGQGSGITTTYLRMLAGNDNFAKPDRHLLNFISNCINRQIGLKEVQLLLEKAVCTLGVRYKNISVRLLDYAIWKYMSGCKCNHL